MKRVEKCLICGAPLETFIAYIPGVGEACIECYRKAGQAGEVVSPILLKSSS